MSANTDSELPEVFDRQIRAFGPDGQRLLRRLRIGVVGGGGTGSATVELLTRLGVGEVTVIDDDVVTDTNITRIHGSGMSHVGVPKATLAQEHARAIGLGTAIHPVIGKVTERAAMERLRHCDVVFGCTDDNAGRIVLARLAYWYLIPVMDMGVIVKGEDGQVNGVYGRVTTMTPGEACVLCRNRVDLQLAREEQQPQVERDQLAREGYAQGAGDPDPAVVTFTTLVAAYAVDELKRRLFGYGEPSSELIVNVGDRSLNTPGRTPGASHFCGLADEWGRGDQDPALGMLWVS
jgi:molybdopterin/thiamine biosynthesis adenylyltransferase